jgi:surfeit locus 1 family protein
MLKNTFRLRSILSCRPLANKLIYESKCNNSSLSFTQRFKNENDNDDEKESKLVALAMLSLPITAFCLGLWQIKRREWKIQLIDMLESRTTAAPIELPLDLRELVNPEYEYRTFKLKGKFDHSKEILIKIRPDITETDTRPGGYILTPFKLSDRNLTVLVNRGYVPYTNDTYKTREGKDKQNTNEEIEIKGILRCEEKINNFTPENRPPLDWHRRDYSLAMFLNTAPVFLDLKVDRLNQKSYPIPNQTIIQLRNEHMSYIATWFTLSVLTAILWYKRYARNLFKK